MSSASEFLFSPWFSSAGGASSGLISAFVQGTIPTDFAISPMTWSGPFSRVTLPLHSGMPDADGTSSVMLRAVPCPQTGAVHFRGPRSCAPGWGAILFTPSPQGFCSPVQMVNACLLSCGCCSRAGSTVTPSDVPRACQQALATGAIQSAPRLLLRLVLLHN